MSSEKLPRIVKKRPIPKGKQQQSTLLGGTMANISNINITNTDQEGYIAESVRYQILKHHNDASPDWVTDMILRKEDDPPIKKFEEDGYMSIHADREPRLIVMDSWKIERSYGRSSNTLKTTVYEMVLMDGSETLIKAVTNSGLSLLLKNTGVITGSTLIIKDFVVLHHSTGNDCTFKKCLLLKNFSWKLPPDLPIKEPVGAGIQPIARRLTYARQTNVVDTEEKTPHSICYDLTAISNCRRSGEIVFTQPVFLDESNVPSQDKLVNVGHGYQEFASGEWILHMPTRGEWIDFVMMECLPSNRKLKITVNA
ncbi:hypothetical protein SEMRO_1834_G300500.1 [Seminavis robusta]|uniref:Uncharacterized protein n=1 Tax=Seminavis robusta TaxID=568900 RepID=A0A9N8HUY5_9STRA|nr:hypothetical protein SEMRO_1834_G300500.1 [Seminavis robusta]|eukprot:Sro1834_g300500.1 n/a (311) ;mRNA; r:3163-4171